MGTHLAHPYRSVSNAARATLRAGLLPLVLALLAAGLGAQTVWTGAVNDSWSEPGNWSAGLPNSTVDAVIPPGTPNAPRTQLVGNSCKALTVQSGATLEIGAGFPLEAHGSINVQGAVLPGDFLIEKASGLISGTGPIPFFRIDAPGATVQVQPRDFAVLQLNDGTLQTIGGGTRTVSGNANFSGGILTEFSGNFDFDGPTVFAGCDVATMPSCVFSSMLGADATFDVTSSRTMTFDGTGQILSVGGATFPAVTFAPGSTVTLQTALEARFNVNFQGTALGGTVACIGAATAQVAVAVGAAADSLRVAKTPGAFVQISGNAQFAGDLEVAGGTLQPIGGGTRVFSGGAQLTGGAITNFSGDFSVRGAVFATGTDVSSMASLAVGGSWTSDASFQAGSGTVTFDGMTPQTVNAAGSTFASLAVAAGAVVNFATPIVASFDLTVAGQTSGQSISLGRHLTMSGSAPASQVWRMTGALQGIATASTPLPHLVVDAGVGAFKQLQGNMTIAGPFELVQGILQPIGGGTRTVLGPANFTGGQCTTFAGDFHFDGPATFAGTDVASMANAVFSADFTADGSFQATSNQLLVFDGTPQTLDASAAQLPRVQFAPGSQVTLTGSLPVLRNLEFQGASFSGLVTCVGSTSTQVSVGGAADALKVDKAPGVFVQIVGNALFTGGLEIASGTLQPIGGGTRTFLGDALLGGGVLTAFTGDFSVRGSVTATGTDVSSMADLAVGGEWSSDASFQSGPATVTFDGTVPQTITAAGSTLGSLTVASGAALTALTSVDLSRDLTVSGSIAGQEIRIGRHFNSHGSVDPAQVWRLVGPMTGIGTGSTPIAHLVVDAPATKQLQGNLLIGGDLTLLQGTLQPIGGGTRTVAGASMLSGGQLTSFSGDFHFDGPVLATGTDVSPMPGSTFSGDLVADASFVLTTSVTLTFDGVGQTIDAAAALFPNVTFAAGSDVTLIGALRATRSVNFLGATFSGIVETSGAATSVVTVSGAADGLRAAKATGATTQILGNALLPGPLELVSGILQPIGGGTRTVQGPATFSGGVLTNFSGDFAFEGVASFAGCDVSAMPAVTFSGDFQADASFQCTSSVVLTFAGTGDLVPLAPGAMVGMPNLAIASGAARGAQPGFVFSARSLSVPGGASLDLDGADATLTGTGDVTVDGAFRLGAGGVLRLGPNNDLDVNPAGALTLEGAGAQPARVVGSSGGGYDAFLNGAISARNFVFEGMGPQGVRIGPSASFAPAPADFRGGVFDKSSGAASSVLLDVQKAGVFAFSQLVFLDTTGTGVFNVRTSAGADVTLLNWAGPFGGAAFEDDPAQTIHWPPPSSTAIGLFTLEPGAEKVRVRFVTVDEVATVGFRVDRATGAGGVFVPVASFAAQGPSAYEFLDTGLVGGQEYVYRVVAQFDFGGEAELVSGAVTPFPGGLPPQVLEVGPGAAFPDIQAAIAAAPGPGTTIRVAAGTYPAFTLGAGAPSGLRIAADGSGPVLVDTSVAPVLVEDLPSRRASSSPGSTSGTSRIRAARSTCATWRRRSSSTTAPSRAPRVRRPCGSSPRRSSSSSGARSSRARALSSTASACTRAAARSGRRLSSPAPRSPSAT
ncbi:MAG: hypothetical protein R3F20_09875 [Planctomycetota bacterium]